MDSLESEFRKQIIDDIPEAMMSHEEDMFKISSPSGQRFLRVYVGKKFDTLGNFWIEDSVDSLLIESSGNMLKETPELHLKLRRIKNICYHLFVEGFEKTQYEWKGRLWRVEYRFKSANYKMSHYNPPKLMMLFAFLLIPAIVPYIILRRIENGEMGRVSREDVLPTS